MQAIRPTLHNLSRLELALATLTRVADLPGRAAHESERTVTGELQVTHHDQLNQVSMVQRRRGRIITAIEGDRSGIQVLAERSRSVCCASSPRHCSSSRMSVTKVVLPCGFDG